MGFKIYQVVLWKFYILLNIVFIFVSSNVSIPFSKISPVGKSSVILVFNFKSLSSSIIKSKYTLYDNLSFPICLNKVPSTFTVSFSLYFSFCILLYIIENSIIPPWFEISKFSPFRYVSCAPTYSKLFCILYSSL